MRCLLATAVAIASVAIAACGNGDQQRGPQTTLQGNVFQNPGFEEGRDPWFSLDRPDFILAEDIAHAGEASALLRMRADPRHVGTKVIYLVQEVTPEQLPEVVSGHYQVTDWARGTQLQYIQFVVIASGADNMPGNFSNHQIRYILAGIDQEPFGISNARFVFLSQDEPPLNQWVPFWVNVRIDFQRLWGAVPEGYEKIRVLFEVRYDGKAIGETAEADVYYDDLYFGPAT